jgi:hypothetical protein
VVPLIAEPVVVLPPVPVLLPIVVLLPVAPPVVAPPGVVEPLVSLPPVVPLLPLPVMLPVMPLLPLPLPVVLPLLLPLSAVLPLSVLPVVVVLVVAPVPLPLAPAPPAPLAPVLAPVAPAVPPVPTPLPVALLSVLEPPPPDVCAAAGIAHARPMPIARMVRFENVSRVVFIGCSSDCGRLPAADASRSTAGSERDSARCIPVRASPLQHPCARVLLCALAQRAQRVTVVTASATAQRACADRARSCSIIEAVDRCSTQVDARRADASVSTSSLESE